MSETLRRCGDCKKCRKVEGTGFFVCVAHYNCVEQAIIVVDSDELTGCYKFVPRERGGVRNE